MNITESIIDDYILLEVFSYVDVYNCNELKKNIAAILELRRGNLAVYLRHNSEHMDSSVISAMISAHKSITAAGFRFAIIIENDELINLLSFAGLKNFFHIFRSLKELEGASA